MFAYVYFLDDKTKAIVPVESIKHFELESDFRKKKYYVLWEETGEYYPAQVLLVEDTKELLNAKISSSKRIKILPQALLETCESSIDGSDTDIGNIDDDDETQLGIATSTQKSNTQKYLQQTAKVKAVMQIMEAHQTKRDAERNRDESVVYDRFESVINQVHQATTPKPSLAAPPPKKTLPAPSSSEKTLKLENTRLKRELEDASEQIKRLRKQNDDLQDLVIKKVNELIETNNGAIGLRENVNVSVPSQPLQNETPTMPAIGFEDDDGRTHLGYDVWIPTERMDSIEASAKRPSLYVRNLATEVWGAAVLKNRSVFGKANPKTPEVQPKPKLSPRKLKAVIGSYRHWLIKKGTSPVVLEQTVNGAFEHISHKIVDLNRTPLTTEERRNKRLQAKTKQQGAAMDTLLTATESPSSS